MVISSPIILMDINSHTIFTGMGISSPIILTDISSHIINNHTLRYGTLKGLTYLYSLQLR